MNAASKKIAERLVLALEDLLAREGLEARHGSAARIRAVQGRISPLVEALARIAGESCDGSLRAKLVRLAERRAENTRLMVTARDGLHAKLLLGKAALERIRRVSPAYGSFAPAAARLNASI